MENMKRTAKDLVGEAKAQVENLSPEQVADELSQENVLLVDLRDGEELREHGRIPQAVHIPRGMLEFRADPTSPYHREELRPERRIILHCASGGRSALGAKTLQEMGYRNVAHLDGGLKAWQESGHAVERVEA
jgi:rhodanese-related sulfurtransferase